MFTRPFLKLLPLLILLLAFGLRLYRLDDQSLRGDEAATVLYAALPVTELWELSRVTDPHPPLYYLMLHPWQWLFGESAWVMRYAGVGASLLAVAALCALSRRTLRSVPLSLLAAGLLAINPLQIWQAQDIRSYPFFTLFGLLSSWALWAALNNGHGSLATKQPFLNNLRTTHDAPRAAYNNSNFTFYVSRHLPCGFTLWLLYILLTVASFYTHYYTVFLIAFQGLFVLVNGRRFWPKRWPWLASQATIGLLLIPGLMLAYNFLGQAAGGIDTVPTLEILRRAATALLTGFTLDDSSGLWASLLLTPVALFGLITLLRRDLLSGSFWGLYCAVPVLGVIALSIGRPFFKERFLIQAQPAFALLLAVGFLTLWQSSRAFAPNHHPRPTPYALRPTFYVSRFTTLLLLLLLLIFNTLSLRNYWHDPAYAKSPPWRLYHDYVAEHAQPGDVMFTNFPEAAVSYYSPNELPFYVAPVERDRSVAFRLEATESIATAYRRIWFLPLQRQGFDEEGEVLNWLDRHADRVNQVFFPDYNLNLYLSPATIEEMMIRQPVDFAPGLQLSGYQIFDEQGRSRLATAAGNTPLLIVKPGEEFTLSLYWQAGQPIAVPYTVFTHLVAADGFNRTGQDNQPVWGSYPTTAWQPGETVTDKYTLTIPAGTPPADHYLHVGWYDSTSGERVGVIGQPDDFVELWLEVRVE